MANKVNPDLVDELAMLIVSVLETHKKYTHEELHKVDRDKEHYILQNLEKIYTTRQFMM